MSNEAQEALAIAPLWLHIGPIHLGYVDHRTWPILHADRVNRAPYRRLHVGPYCFRIRFGKPQRLGGVS